MAVEDAGKKFKAQAEAERNDWRQRVKDETEEIKGRVDRLHNFIESSSYYGVHDDEKALLQTQLQQMRALYNTLKQRIAVHGRT